MPGVPRTNLVVSQITMYDVCLPFCLNFVARMWANCLVRSLKVWDIVTIEDMHTLKHDWLTDNVNVTWGVYDGIFTNI